MFVTGGPNGATHKSRWALDERLRHWDERGPGAIHISLVPESGAKKKMGPPTNLGGHWTSDSAIGTKGTRGHERDQGPSTFPWYRRVGGPIQSLVPEAGSGSGKRDRSGKREAGQEAGSGKRDRSAIGNRSGKRSGKRDTKREAGQVRYWQYGQAENSPDLAISDLSRFLSPVPLPVPDLSRFLS